MNGNNWNNFILPNTKNGLSTNISINTNKIKNNYFTIIKDKFTNKYDALLFILDNIKLLFTNEEELEHYLINIGIPNIAYKNFISLDINDKCKNYEIKNLNDTYKYYGYKLDITSKLNIIDEIMKKYLFGKYNKNTNNINSIYLLEDFSDGNTVIEQYNKYLIFNFINGNKQLYSDKYTLIDKDEFVKWTLHNNIDYKIDSENNYYLNDKYGYIITDNKSNLIEFTLDIMSRSNKIISKLDFIKNNTINTLGNCFKNINNREFETSSDKIEELTDKKIEDNTEIKLQYLSTIVITMGMEFDETENINDIKTKSIDFTKKILKINGQDVPHFKIYENTLTKRSWIAGKEGEIYSKIISVYPKDKEVQFTLFMPTVTEYSKPSVQIFSYNENIQLEDFPI